MYRWLASALVMIGLLLGTPSIIWAAESDFATDLSSVYTVAANGSTVVEHQFTLTNLTPTMYVTKYAYQTSLTALQNISVISNGQRIEPQVVTTADRTTISFSFPDEVVGEGRQRQFSISFASDVFSTKAGEVLEVTIPALNSSSPYRNHTVDLVVAQAHGSPYRLSPTPDDTEYTNQGLRYQFSPYQGEAITAVFGQEQTYLVSAEYLLDNPLPTQSYTVIALPPDTTWQQAYYQRIDPKPDFMETDPDGNWLAGYYLEPTSQKTVTAQAHITVSLQPLASGRTTPPQPAHFSSLPFWESDRPEILSLANQFDTIEETYSGVVETLQYTQAPLTYDRARYGAIQALANPTDAVCQEFTDVFIALARANGVAARRATGYAFTNQPEIRPLSLEGDVLHAWPEFFDDATQLWQPVDPTWENTTGGVDYFNFFDLNHIVFAYNGVDSSLPAPAGSYKPSHDQQAKTVEVTIASPPPAISPQFSVEVQPHKLGPITIPGWYNVSVSNQTGKAWYGVSFDLQATGTDASWRPIETKQLPDTMLPFMTVQQSVLVTTSEWKPITAPIILEISLADGPTYYAESPNQHVIIPSYLTSVTTYLVVGGCLTIITLVSGSVLVWRQRRDTPLRWESQESQG